MEKRILFTSIGIIFLVLCFCFYSISQHNYYKDLWEKRGEYVESQNSEIYYLNRRISLLTKCPYLIGFQYDFGSGEYILPVYDSEGIYRDTLYDTVYVNSGYRIIYDTVQVIFTPQVGIITDLKVYYIDPECDNIDSMWIEGINPRDSRR